MHCLPEGYVERLDNEFFDDTVLTDECQKEVYEYARDIEASDEFCHVSDVGCGSGYKLLKYFPHAVTVGYDLLPTVEWLKKTYPEQIWKAVDFNKIRTGDGKLPFTYGGLVVCADVIEHIPNADNLMCFLTRMGPKKLILSTPERLRLKEIQSDWRESGPPVNPCHVREWSFDELETYVSRWFKVDAHFISNEAQATQVMLCSSR